MAQAAFQTATQDSDIRIYAACLAAYNNGILHGRWINADQDADDIHSEIAAMLKASPIQDAEEYAIHDYEGFEGVSLSEYHGIDEVAALAAFIAEHGELGAELFKHYGDIDTAETALEDDYCGEYCSLAEYAEQLTEETVSIPESLRYYIDYDAMARDIAMGDVLVIETGIECVHVFWSR
jgi:antirestriction protein